MDIYTFLDPWDVGISITVWCDLTYELTWLIVCLPPSLHKNKSSTRAGTLVWLSGVFHDVLVALDKYLQMNVLLSTESTLSSPASAIHPSLCCQWPILKGVPVSGLFAAIATGGHYSIWKEESLGVGGSVLCVQSNEVEYPWAPSLEWAVSCWLSRTAQWAPRLNGCQPRKVAGYQEKSLAEWKDASVVTDQESGFYGEWSLTLLMCCFLICNTAFPDFLTPGGRSEMASQILKHHS